MNQDKDIVYNENGITVEKIISIHPYDNDNMIFLLCFGGEEYRSCIHDCVIGFFVDDPKMSFRFDSQSGVLFVEVSVNDFDDFKEGARFVVVKWFYEFDTKQKTLTHTNTTVEEADKDK